MKKIRKINAIILAITAISAYSAETPKKPNLQFLGAFDAGQPDAGIYKVYDQTDDVVCYVLMPEVASRSQDNAGKWRYEGNNLGSISCLKVKFQAVSANQNQSSSKKK